MLTFLMFGLVFCMTNMFMPVSLQKCTSSSDCNPRSDLIVCGICAEDKLSGNQMCQYLFEYKYPYKDKYCETAQTCPDNCNSQGTCVTKSGVSFCVCSKDYYGSKCELPIPTGLVDKIPIKGAYIATEYIARPVRVHNVRVNLKCSPFHSDSTNPLQQATYIVECDQGFYVRVIYNIKGLFPNCDFNTEVYHTYEALVRFPFRLYKNTSLSKGIDFLTLGDTVVGYVSTVTVTTKMLKPELTIFTTNLKTAVLYDNVFLKCVADISLFNCGKSIDTSITYYAYQRISLVSQITFIEDGGYKSTSVPNRQCDSRALMIWSIWRELSHWLSDSHDDPVKIQFHEKHFIFKEFSLKFGQYLAKFEIDSFQSNAMAKNLAYCYFKVKAQPLKPIIDGGSERTVLKRFGILLSCKNSVDPNSPPSDQDHMSAIWSCVDLNDPGNKPSFCAETTRNTSEVHLIPGDQLNYGSKFRFTLLVYTTRWDWCVEKDIGCDGMFPSTTVDITIPKQEDEEEDSIILQCVRNCGEKVISNQRLLLKVVSLGNIEVKDVEWTVMENNTETLELSGLIFPDLPPPILLLKENMLKMGTKYTISVKDASATFGAAYKFETYTIEYEGSCTIYPESGDKGKTWFDIECDPGDPDSNFDFYNKHPEESTDDLMFSGRMIGSSKTGSLYNVKLTREKVYVYIINRVGLFKQRSIDVKLNDQTVDEKALDEFYSDLDRTMWEGNDMQTLQCVSFIPDIVPDSIDKSLVLNRLLSTISLIPIRSFAKIRMATSTLNNVLVGLNKPTRLDLNPSKMMQTLSLMHRLTSFFSYMMSVGESFQSKNSPKELYQIAEVLIDTLHNILISRDPDTGNKDPDDYDFETLNVLMKGSIDAENILLAIQDVLAQIQSPGQPPIQISSSNKDIVVWVMENDDTYPITNYINDSIPVKLTSDDIKHFQYELLPNETLALQVSMLKENIFWWCKSDVKSNLVSVSFSRETPSGDMIKINDVSKPIDVHIKFVDNVEGMKVTGNTTQPETTLSPVELDRSVQVHRLDPEAGSINMIKFLYPPTKHKLRVVISSQFRPDYDMIVDEPEIISEASTIYPVPLVHKEDDYFLFMGILPAADVPVNEEVPYAFQVDSKLCQHWAQGQWSSSGCTISLESEASNVVCSCDHFSIFSAAFPVPPQEINPFDDIPLFLTVPQNPLVFVVVLILLFVYFILCVWAWYKDRLDKYKRTVVILEDNCPGDRFPYLVVVYTSSRFNSGTTANVGLRIYGSLSYSKVHILASKNRKLLRKDSDDWFLIYCSELLGNIKSIHIWHDSAGSDPDWHLDKIIVYSLEESTETVFVFEQWLALRADEYPEALVKPYTKSDVTSIKRMFLDNCVFGLRENHILLSVILRHPRSGVTRLQRVSTVMVGIMVAMLCSIMFYAPVGTESELEVDDPVYDVSKRDFYISIQTMVLSVIATLFIFIAFNRSYKIVKPDGYKYAEKKKDEVTREEKSVYGNFVKFVIKTLKSRPLNPVQLPYSEPLIVVRKVWLTIAWTLCIGVIFISSFFVMLYGLKLGAAKSKKWLTSLLLTVGEDVFVQGPGKIMLISIILSFAFQRVCEVNTHRVSLKDVRDIEPPNEYKFIKTLLAKRSHPMYAPLRSDVKAVIMEKKQLYHNFWLITDFTLSLLFVINVCVAIFYLWSSHYYANSQVVRSITASPYTDNGTIDFFQVKTVGDLEQFFKQALIRSLYTRRWYNHKVFEGFERSKQYWNDDFVHKMLGQPMLRQLRVFPQECKNLVLDGRKQCVPVWSYSVEDNDLYGPGWRTGRAVDTHKQNSPWSYKDRSTSKTNTKYRLYGASGRLYDNGGFSVTLGPTRQDTELMIADLLDRRWQDVLTKVVFLELTLYNVNQDLFSQVTCIVEYLAPGSIQLKAQVISVEGKLQLRAWNVFFVLFFIFYLVRAARIINRAGLLDYMKSLRNITRLIVLVLCFLCFLTAGLHWSLSKKFHSEFQQKTTDSYFDFDSFIVHFSNLKFVLSTLFCVSMIRMMILFRGGRRFLNHIYTIKLSWDWILCLTAIAIILVIFLHNVALFFNIFGGHSVLQIVINHRMSHYFSAEDMSSPGVRIFFFVKTVCLAVIHNSFVIIFIYNSSIAKTYNIKRLDHFSFIGFVLSLLSPTKYQPEPKRYV